MGRIERGDTWVDNESMAYPSGGFTRKGRARLRRNPHNRIEIPYGEIQAIRCSVPDTMFTISARFRYRGKTIAGFISVADDTGELTFTPEADPDNCHICLPDQGCRFRGVK